MRYLPIVTAAGGWGHMGGWGWGMAIFGSLFMLLIVGLVVWLITSNVIDTRANRSSGRPNPLDVLDQRYASGDVDREEYLQRRADLEERR